MKKLTAILGIVFAVSTILFVASVGGNWAALSVGGNNLPSELQGEKTNRIYTESFDNIEISTIFAIVTLDTSSDGNTYINYKSSDDLIELRSSVSGKNLKIEEKNKKWITFWPWGRQSELEILIPEKEYNKFFFGNTSGKVAINDLFCKDFRFESTSGDIELYVGAENFYFDNTSGSLYAENIGKKDIDNLDIFSTTGNLEIKGFSPDRYRFDLTSGTIRAYNLSGNGKMDLVSGNIITEYDYWNDNLEIECISGGVKVTLPEESGIDIDVDRTSGSVNVDLNGQSGELKDGSYTIGGANRHDVDVDIISGNIDITN
ncbi:MAG: DUF4097 domain-containing protein [Eubacterium sp.]|jgi:DUF4097 and DUF4098 domain-containing protein YvlB|nr:DUF4097 domain-containing protein [Eubacterium sp.]